jgi:hypothetical protein
MEAGTQITTLMAELRQAGRRIKFLEEQFVVVKRDAERYRWLRKLCDLKRDALDRVIDLLDEPESAEHMDRIIDAAIARGS